MTLCQKCSEIPLSFFHEQEKSGEKSFFKSITRYHHWESLQKLKRSAGDGCGLCTLLYDSFLARLEPPFTELEESSEHSQNRVLLNSWIKLVLNVECGHFFGSLFGHLEFDVPAKSQETHQEDAGFEVYPANRVQHDANSPSNFEMIRLWIDTCMSSHDKCASKSISTSRYFPSRLIRISATADKRILSLVDTHGITPGDTRYITLSHCWGEPNRRIFVSTTTENIETRKVEIDWNELSKTFQDAVEIAENLGVYYLWIDSICIIQNDPDDVTAECGIMGGIYSNAYCTIAASDAQDGQAGCFIKRNPLSIQNATLSYRSPEVQPRARVTIFPKFGSWENSLNGPLQKRGWTLQERQLSPRTLHYTTNRILWECRACRASEDNPEGFGEGEEYDASGNFDINWKLLDGGYAKLALKAPSDLYEKWRALTISYSGRLLRFKSDRLVAISALAAELGNLLPGDRYLAGIWEGDFCLGLTWRPDRNRNKVARHPLAPSTPSLEWPPSRSCPGVPSWSWASFYGQIDYFEEDFTEHWLGEYSMKLLEANPILTTPNLYSTLSSCDITVTGYGFKITVGERERLFEGYDMRNPLYNTHKILPRHGGGRIYFDTVPNELPEIEILCFNVKSTENRIEAATHQGLVLLEVQEGRQGYFQRVGWYSLWCSNELWLELRKKMMITII